MSAKVNLVRFDWAVKRLLRQKTNFVILEGFLSTLLNESVRIVRMLESEGNKENAEDKFNRVDMLAENGKGELIIIEVQNNRELDYFHRMLYGTSKVITEYICEGDEYDKVRKVYSVNIVYFDLGQGEDYVYHGGTEFRGIHKNDVLKLSIKQREQFTFHNAGALFPEYYILRVDDFDQKAKTPLDEWIAFLKTGIVNQNTKAPGLIEARERLRLDQLSTSERKAYDRHVESLRYQKSVIKTGIIEGREEGREEGRAEGRAEGRLEGRVEGRAEGLTEGRIEGLVEGLTKGRAEGEKELALKIARKAKAEGLPIGLIVELTGLSEKEVLQI